MKTKVNYKTCVPTNSLYQLTLKGNVISKLSITPTPTIQFNLKNNHSLYAEVKLPNFYVQLNVLQLINNLFSLWKCSCTAAVKRLNADVQVHVLKLIIDKCIVQVQSTRADK